MINLLSMQRSTRRLLSTCAALAIGVVPLTVGAQTAPATLEGVRSILVVPSVNKSLDVDAPLYVLSALTIPLAERGYYVFPVYTVKTVLEQEGLYEPERIFEQAPSELAGLFGADAVLYVTIRQWDAKYVILSTVVTVDFDYVLKSKTGEVLWKNRQQMQYTPQQQAQAGGLAAVLISAAIAAAAARAAPNYMPLTQQANLTAIAGHRDPLPLGPYRTQAK